MAIWIQEALAAASIVVFGGSVLFLASIGEMLL